MQTASLTRRTLLQAGAALAATGIGTARAGGKPLTILVGYAPGGPVDIVAREFAEPLRELLGRPVLVDYKPGAGGQFALTALKQAPADGNLLALSPPSPLTIFPSTFSKLAGHHRRAAQHSVPAGTHLHRGRFCRTAKRGVVRAVCPQSYAPTRARQLG